MKRKTGMKIIAAGFAALCITLTLSACDADGTESATGGTKSAAGGTEQNIHDTQTVTDELATAQSTPTDIDYSLERYNLIRRAYWVNGQREKANTLICQVDRPLGYIVLFAGNTTVGRFTVDGKVSSLNSFLSPDYVEHVERHFGDYGGNVVVNTELADVDGSYGENDNGIFFFTPDGKYVEWTGEYLYSDIPFEVDNPVVEYQEARRE